MPAQLIDGRAVAAQVEAGLRPRIERLRAAGITPKLTALLVGDNPASVTYVRNKQKAAERVGIRSELRHLPTAVTAADLFRHLDECNQDSAVHGILVQSPLPEHIDEMAVNDAVNPDKDVDGFHPYNLGRLLIGQATFVSCTPAGVMRLLAGTGVSLSGKEAVVLGRSNIVGKPMATLLMQRGVDATVTVAHSRTKHLPDILRRAEILIAAIGQPEFVTAAMIREGAVVIDVGINRIERDGRSVLVGDVHMPSVREKAGWLTPVPGGVGPMTIAQLLENTVLAAERLSSRKN